MYESQESFSLLHDCYFTEQQCTCFTQRRYTAVDNGSESPLVTAHTDREIPHTRRVAPHVVEGGGGEVAAPVESDTQPAEGGQDLVAETLATFKTGEAVFPDTIDGAHPFWLTKNFLECDLKHTITDIFNKQKQFFYQSSYC